MCRSLPHGNHFSVTAYEKADAQIIYTRDREVPKRDPQLTAPGTGTGYVTLNGSVSHLSIKFTDLPKSPLNSILIGPN